MRAEGGEKLAKGPIEGILVLPDIRIAHLFAFSLGLNHKTWKRTSTSKSILSNQTGSSITRNFPWFPLAMAAPNHSMMVLLYTLHQT